MRPAGLEIGKSLFGKGIELAGEDIVSDLFIPFVLAALGDPQGKLPKVGVGQLFDGLFDFGNRAHVGRVPLFGSPFNSQLSTCKTTIDVPFTEETEEASSARASGLKQGAFLVMPRNEGLPGNPEELALRKLDCALLNWAIPILEAQAGQKFHTVRGVFQEGEPAYEGSSITRKSHIQIVVRETCSILGYFRPESLTDD